jgi:hypothetical protein
MGACALAWVGSGWELVQLTEKEKEGRDGWGRGLVVVKVYVMGMMVERWKGGVLYFGFQLSAPVLRGVEEKVLLQIVHESWNSNSIRMTWIIFISFHSFCFLLSLSKEFSSDLSLSLSEKHRERSLYIQEVKTHQERKNGKPEFRSQLLFSALVKQKSEQTMQR